MQDDKERAMTTYTALQTSPTDLSEERSVSLSGSEDENPSLDEGRQDGPSKKRKRSLKISCELCKARKVKCDRAEPACGWCAKNSRVCVYKERQKPGLRVGYGRELEEKINRLDALLQVMGRRLEDHILDHGSPQHFRPGSIRLPSQPAGLSPYPSSVPTLNASVVSQDTPVSDSRWSSANAYERMQSSRPHDAMSIRSVVDTTGQDMRARTERANSATTAWYARSTPAPSVPDSDLPPYDMLYTIVDLYFKHVNPWSPILDRKATVDAFFNTSAMTESNRVLLHAIVATTLRFSRDPRLTPESRKQYHDVSKQKVQLYAFENSNVTALQALVILAVDVLGRSNGQQGFNLLALIARSVVQLGLDVERSVYLDSAVDPKITSSRCTLPAPKSWIEDEERRRLCWMTFVLDRYATVASASNFAMDEREMDRSLPCRYDLLSRNEPVETRWHRVGDRPEAQIDKAENLGSFSYHCEVLGILSRIHRFLHQPLDITRVSDIQRWRETYRELDGELQSWLQHLPGEYGKISQLCHSDPGSRISNWIMLHAAFVTSVIRLHSSAAYPTIRSHIFTPSYHAIQRCLGAVESLREIAQDVLNTGMLDLLGHPFAFALWVSARLLLVHAATMECDVDPNIRFFISTLEQMGQHWPVAQNYATILSHVVQEGQPKDQPYDGSNGPQKTFTAMRRLAYDLSLLVSQKPRSVLDPATSRTPSSNELVYLEVFDFFNYPRLPTAVRDDSNPVARGATATVAADGASGAPQTLPTPTHDFRIMANFAIPNPESDWLIFKPPYE